MRAVLLLKKVKYLREKKTGRKPFIEPMIKHWQLLPTCMIATKTSFINNITKKIILSVNDFSTTVFLPKKKVFFSFFRDKVEFKKKHFPKVFRRVVASLQKIKMIS